MAEESYLLSLLKDFGFSQYEAQVLVELYKKSPQTAKNIAKGSKVSLGRIYDVLEKLRQKGLLFELRYAGKTKLYELRAFPESLDILREKKIKELNTIYYFLEKEFKKIERVIQESVSLTKDEVIFLKSEDALKYHLKDLLKNVKKEVIVNFPPKLLQEHNNFFIDLSKRDIECAICVDVKNYNDKRLKTLINNEKMKKWIKKESEDVLPTMIIVDKKSSLVIFRDNFEEGLLIQNPELVLSQLYSLSHLSIHEHE